MKILLTRHPVTKANIRGIIEHNLEGELHMRGYPQIKRLRDRLRKEEIEIIYSSDAYRCRKLAIEIAKDRHIPINYNHLFRELNHGNSFGKSKEDLDRLSLPNSEDFCPEGGESLRELAERSKEAFSYVISQDYSTSLVISHGWFLKMFVGNQIGMNILDAIRYLKFSNCALSEISLKNGNLIVEYLNDRSFL
mgnify:CR=1 FL=1